MSATEFGSMGPSIDSSVMVGVESLYQEFPLATTSAPSTYSIGIASTGTSKMIPDYHGWRFEWSTICVAQSASTMWLGNKGLVVKRSSVSYTGSSPERPGAEHSR